MKNELKLNISRRQFLKHAGLVTSGLILSACTPTQSVENPTITAPPSTAPSITVAPSQTIALTTPTTVAPLKINVLWRGPSNPVNPDGELYKELVKKTGVAYTGFGMQTGPDYTQKVNTLMASGQPPELMWINDRLTYQQYAQQGAFWQLDDLLKDKTTFPNITSYDPDSYNALRVNGKLFAIPSARTYRGFPVHIRTDWLDKLNLKMPTTVDELWTVAEAFATKDPDGNGKKDTYGLMWWQSQQGLDQILNGFGIVSSWEEDKPGHIVPAFISSKYKNMLAWLRKGIEAGIFDPDSPIMKRDEVETTKGNAGKCGIFYTGLGSTTLDALKKNNPDARILPMPPLKTPEGKYVYGIPYLYIGLWVITKSVKTEEDVQKILKFIEFGSSPDGSSLMNYGVPGDYDVNPDGTMKINEKGKADGASALWLIPPQDKYLYVKQEQAAGHPELADAQKKLVDSVEGVTFSDPILFTSPGPVEIEKGSGLTQKRDEVFGQILTGKVPISAFDDWAASWLKDGGDQIITERNASYSTYKK